MSKELIVSVNGREKKIAIIEDDVVTEFYVERGDENQGIVGNIYKGRVMKVLPGMQSAFVDIGLERDSFLYVSDFFDEEELDEDEVEETPAPAAAVAQPEQKQPARTNYRDRQRQAREARDAAYAAARALEEKGGEEIDRDAELAAAAIQHIEDLAEEPEIEPAPGDELMTGLGIGAVISAGALLAEALDLDEPEPVSEIRDVRQRRRNRLKVTEPSSEAEPVVAPTDLAEAESGEVAELTSEVNPETGDNADNEEEAGGRRRRRRRRRGGSAAEAIEVEAEDAPSAVEAVDAEVVETSEDESEPVEVPAAVAEAPAPEPERKPYVIVHHNPFERIVDDEIEPSTGEMLKDAILQERLAEQVRAEEFRTTVFDVEPTPEVTVGSLSRNLGRPTGFERISDDEEAPVVAATPAPEPAAEAPASPIEEPAPVAEALVAETPATEAPVEEAAPAVEAAPAAVEAPAVEAAPEPEPEAVPEPKAAPVAEAVQEVIPVEEAPVAAEPEPAPVVIVAPVEEPAPIVVPAPVLPPAPAPTSRRRTKELSAEVLPAPAPVEPPALPKEVSVVELLGDVEVLPLNLSDAPTDDLLGDATAEVRQRPRKGEMAATRRGGRGRRRNNFPQRRPVTEATADAEDYVDPGEEDGDAPVSYMPPPAPVVPRPTLHHTSHTRETSGYGGSTHTSHSTSSTASASHGATYGAARYQRPVITDLLREGQEIIVQIAKEPIGQKGARITSHVALPGRYIVYMPTVEHIGVSRKIGTDEERQRLKRTLHTLRAEAGATGGFIVRTAANGCTLEELRDDMLYLVRTWNDMRRRADRVKAPAIIHRDLDLVQRILRDQLSGDFSAIRVDNEIEYERMVDFVNRFAPKMVNRVKLYTKDTPILEHYGVQAEIDKAVKPRVWLKSGGYIVINQTEALVAIDVNTGKFVGKSNRLEDTIVKTNLEAAKEIVRQIRLRDLGGIIVLDFIDMEERRNRQKVLQALEYEMRNDKAPSKVLQFNDFGLVAVTRKRVKQSLERTLCTPCSYCGGGGMVKSAQTIAYEILAEARRISKDVNDANEVILRVHPEVAKALRSSERDVLQEIEAYLGGVVSIKSDPAVHQEQFDIALS